MAAKETTIKTEAEDADPSSTFNKNTKKVRTKTKNPKLDKIQQAKIRMTTR